MIAVLADDFTGAAEISGIAIRYGLKTELQTDILSDPQSDIYVVDTNTRSATKDAAMATFDRILPRLLKLEPLWIFKKTDSVLRGHVLHELNSTMKACGKKMTLLIPTNPGKGRIIHKGNYYINGELLHKTTFSDDPDYPARTADVLKLLGSPGETKTSVLKPDQHLPLNGIVVGETRNQKELEQWTKKWKSSMLPAGGAEFFEMLLQQVGYQENIFKSNQKLVTGKRVLAVWGSSLLKTSKTYDIFRNAGFNIVEIPVPPGSVELIKESAFTEMIRLVSDKMSCNERVVFSFKREQSKKKAVNPLISEIYGNLVKEIVPRFDIKELLIEGGSTASTIVRKLNWERFTPVQEILPGVVRLQVESHPGIYLTVKPGSYDWPSNLI